MGNTKVEVGGVSKPALDTVLFIRLMLAVLARETMYGVSTPVVLRCTRMLALEITAARSLSAFSFSEFPLQTSKMLARYPLSSPAQYPSAGAFVRKPQGAIGIVASFFSGDSTLFFCTRDPPPRSSVNRSRLGTISDQHPEESNPEIPLAITMPSRYYYPSTVIVKSQGSYC